MAFSQWETLATKYLFIYLHWVFTYVTGMVLCIILCILAHFTVTTKPPCEVRNDVAIGEERTRKLWEGEMNVYQMLSRDTVIVLSVCYPT